MEIRCHKCQKIYNIDEAKIPEKGKVFVKCSSCQEKIEVSRQIKNKSYSNSPPIKEHEPPIEYFDPDAKTALIYCQEIQARLEMGKKLAELGFETREIKNDADIRHHFRYNIFDMIILYQHGPDPDTNIKSILDYINHMPSHVRRSTLVIYIHLSGNRYDLYDAFSRGVDATLSPMDISQFSDIVPAIIDHKKQNYKVFFDCLSRIEESVI